MSPVILSKSELDKRPIKIRNTYITDIITNLWPSIHSSPTIYNAAFEIIDQTYDLLFYLNEKLNNSAYNVSQLYSFTVYDKTSAFFRWRLTHRPDFASFFGHWDYIQYYLSEETILTPEDVERVTNSAILGLAHVGRRYLFPSGYNYFMNQMNGITNILLYYLPNSNNAGILVSTAREDNQHYSILKSTMLIASISYLMNLLDSWLRPHCEHLQEVIALCKQIIKTLIANDPGADINTLLTYSLHIRIGEQEETLIRVVVKETFLAFVKRRIHWGPDLISDIATYLCNLGAIDRRLFHGIESEWKKFVHDRKRNVLSMGHRLTRTQSEQLSYAYPHESLRKHCIRKHWSDNLIGLEPEDAIPTEPDPQAEELVHLLLSQTP